MYEENTNLFGLISTNEASFTNFSQQLFVFRRTPTKPTNFWLTAASDYHPILSMSAQNHNKKKNVITCIIMLYEYYKQTQLQK